MLEVAVAVEGPAVEGGPVEATDELLDAAGTFVTGAAAMCSHLPSGAPVGLVVTSFAVVADEPPTVAVQVDRRAPAWAAMQSRVSFAVSVLAAEHGWLHDRLSGPRVDRLDGVGWTPAPSGCPVVAGALAWFDCTTVARYLIGDRELIVGRVNACAATARHRSPLVRVAGR